MNHQFSRVAVRRMLEVTLGTLIALYVWLATLVSIAVFIDP